MGIQTITTPGGEELVILSRRDYQDLIDARDHAIALRDVDAGALETLCEAELDAYLAAPTPLAFWRKRRGLTQVALARTVRVSQSFLNQVEAGKRRGDVRLHARLARALGVRMEDLLADDDDAAA